jgi:hypothetical protein
MDVAIFRDIALRSSHVNRRFGGTYHLPFQGRKSAEQEASMHQVARQKMATFVVNIYFFVIFKVRRLQRAQSDNSTSIFWSIPFCGWAVEEICSTKSSYFIQVFCYSFSTDRNKAQTQAVPSQATNRISELKFLSFTNIIFNIITKILS